MSVASPAPIGAPTWSFSLPFPVRGVIRRWRALLGMTLGVGIALGVSMLMLGISTASSDVLTSEFRDSGAGLYVLAGGGKLIPLLPGDSPGVIDEGRDVLRLLRSTPGVTGAFGTVSWSLERELPGPKQRDAVTELLAVVGVDGDPASVPRAVSLVQGHWMAREDEIVLGTRLARELGIGPGDRIRLSGRDFSIVGVGRLLGVGMSGGAVAYMDARALARRAEIGETLNVVIAASLDPESARQRLLQTGEYRVLTPNEAIAEAEEVLAADRVGHWIFIVLTLTIAGLFVASVLGRSVAERRLEFATLKAIGVPNRTILAAVVAEAMLVSLPAGIVAVGLSTLLGAGINAYVAPAYDFDRLYAVNAQLFTTVFALAVALGAGAGLVPAVRATRVDPVEVLREA